MSLLRRRAAHRSCPLHGDNGCEIQGEAGPRERHHDKRVWRVDVDAILAELGPEYDDQGDDRWGSANLTPCGPNCALYGEGGSCG